MGLLLLLARRLADGEADHRVLLVSTRDSGDVAARERALDELVEAVAVSLLEGRSLRLPVVGEDDDLVRPRGVVAGALDVPEVVVELAQRLEGVGTLEARVVGDLVVARERRVDRGAPAHDVGEHARHDQVAHEHAERSPHQRVDAAAVAARLHVAADRAKRRDPFEDDLPAEQDERARCVVAVGEERPVAGVRLLLSVHSADGEDHVLGLAGEQVAAAGATVDEEADAGSEPALELGAIGRRGARHRRRRLLLHPAKRGDVLVRAQEDARLARARLRGEIGLPLGEPVRLARPARHVRGIAVAHRALQHGLCEAVDLEVDDPRDVGARDDALALGDPVRGADRPRVVRAEKNCEHHAHRGDDECREQSPAEVVDGEHPVGHVQAGGDLKDQRVRDQHEQEPEDERERQS